MCKDKFCNNCKKVIQAARSMRYLKQLESYDDYLYHLTLTVPSCSSENLKDTIKLLFKNFKYLNRLLTNDYKSEIWEDKGCFSENITLSDFGYCGAIRSLEVTWGKDKNGDTWYHPHLHCAMLFMGDFSMGIKNRLVEPYSYKRNDINVYPFSCHDIFFQRIWYLLLNKQKITKENMEKINKVRRKLKDDIRGKYFNTGYSCNITKFDKGQYAELFKYMVKEVDFENNVLDYDTFKTLYFSLFKVKQIQGYGFFYNIKDDSYDKEINEINEFIEEYLSNFEFNNKREHILTVRKNINNGNMYISKKRIMKFIKENESKNKIEKSYKEDYKERVKDFTMAIALQREECKNENNTK